MVTSEKVAKLIDAFRFDNIPPDAVNTVKLAVLDTLGVAMIARDEPVVRAALKIFGKPNGAGEAHVWATGESRPIREAVFLNALSVHCIDYDNGGSLGHPAAVFLPCAIALAEKYQLPGNKVIEAYALAYELGTKLRNSMGDLQFGAGFHATSLLGCVCAAAISAKLMGLDPQGIRNAIAIGCSLASGLLISFGTDAKPIQVARASENGLLAAQLAAEGCTGETYIFEENKGFYYVYAQEEGSIKALTENFGKPLALTTERSHFKQWACCGGNYEILSLLYDLLAEEIIPLEDIESMRICTSMVPPGPAFRTAPKTPMEGRFSITYNAASCLVDHVVDLSTFTQEKFDRPIVHELMRKMTVEWHPECAGKPRRLLGESRFVTMDFHMKDGRVISRRQDASGRKQLEDSKDIYLKFVENGRLAGLAEETISAVIETVNHLESAENISELMSLIR